MPPVEVAERVEATRVGAVVAVEVFLELPAPAAVEIHQARDVDGLHEIDHLLDIALHPGAVVRDPTSEVGMEVDGRYTRVFGGVVG